MEVEKWPPVCLTEGHTLSVSEMLSLQTQITALVGTTTGRKSLCKHWRPDGNKNDNKPGFPTIQAFILNKQRF